MNSIFTRSLGLVSLWLSFLAVASPSVAGEPLELVRSVSDQAIAILQDPGLKGPGNKPQRVARLKAIVNPVFDYEEMAQRTLAGHWRRRSAAEQQEFVKLFRGFLEKIYTDKADLYDGERFALGRETIDREFAEVESRLIDAKRQAATVIYRLRRGDGGWKIYDAVVEEISIVNNYRAQFDRVIGKSSYQELIKMLRDKGA